MQQESLQRRLTRSSYSCRCKSIVSTCWENRQVVRWLSYVESLSLMFSFFLCTRLQHRLHPWLRMLTVRRRNQTKNRSITITRLSLLLEFRVSLVCSCKYCNGFLCCGSDVMKLASSLSTWSCAEYRQLQIGSEDSSFRDAKGPVGH